MNTSTARRNRNLKQTRILASKIQLFQIALSRLPGPVHLGKVELVAERGREPEVVHVADRQVVGVLKVALDISLELILVKFGRCFTWIICWSTTALFLRFRVAFPLTAKEFPN